MKRALERTKESPEAYKRGLPEKERVLYNIVDGGRVEGPHATFAANVIPEGAYGDCTRLEYADYVTGCVTGLYGDAMNLVGDVTFLSGDCTGIEGDAYETKGNLDDCELTEEEREFAGLEDLVE
tara:strand:- start:85 stop:456 length:372 start_codon:yes stop_codon:yes gene_type:complete